MNKNGLILEKLLSVDNTGLPQPPTLRQLQDKDVLLLFTRDRTHDKSQYMKEVGVIYYLGDPQSPAKQQGLSDRESLKAAIDNYNLPKDYTPDNLVKKLIDKYYHTNIGEAGLAVEALHRSVHLISIAATKINDRLNNKLSEALIDEDITPIVSMMSVISKHIQEIPSLTMALKAAYENLKYETESEIGRGGKNITSSMDADEGI